MLCSVKPDRHRVTAKPSQKRPVPHKRLIDANSPAYTHIAARIRSARTRGHARWRSDPTLRAPKATAITHISKREHEDSSLPIVAVSQFLSPTAASKEPGGLGVIHIRLLDDSLRYCGSIMGAPERNGYDHSSPRCPAHARTPGARGHGGVGTIAGASNAGVLHAAAVFASASHSYGKLLASAAAAARAERPRLLDSNAPARTRTPSVT